MAPAKKVDDSETSAIVNDGTVWLDYQGGVFHVQVGSPTWERLTVDGATEVPAPE